jgi:hypothetical protein
MILLDPVDGFRLVLTSVLGRGHRPVVSTSLEDGQVTKFFLAASGLPNGALLVEPRDDVDG